MNSIDVQDWEILPSNGFLEDGGSKIQSNSPNTNSLVSYFFSQTKSAETRVHPEMHNQLALEPTSPDLQGQEDAVNHTNQEETGMAEFRFEEKGKPCGKTKAEFKESEDCFNIWKLSLFGVAAAGVCIIISWGKGNSNKQKNQKQHR